MTKLLFTFRCRRRGFFYARNPAAVDASRVSLSRLVLIAAASEVTPAKSCNLGCRHRFKPR